MAKKTTKSAAAGDKPFSTEEISKAIDKALGQLRAERKKRARDWTLGQHLQAAACEASLVMARKHSSCSTSSHTFPTPMMKEEKFLGGLKG